MDGGTDRRALLTIVLGLIVIIPFVWLLIEFFQPFEPVNADFTIRLEASDILFSVYIFILFLLFSALVSSKKTIARREKFAWILCLMIFFPVTHLALIYRLYWHKPVRVARSLSEQVEILRDLRAERMKDQSGRQRD